ncbi:MAG: hypothetical protein QGG48_14090, partial [Desulfatiglandales bacterium]|nr:hypothetical protein [Desulfatiglandales bacterium]
MNFVILMPLCSGFITFEGLGALSGSRWGSKVPPGGAKDGQKGPLEEPRRPKRRASCLSGLWKSPEIVRD